ncbi:hypothetical protein A2U01_0087813, partial [Trifolium medium]|nr:hypothetical protein [Trifolium medium]
APHRQSARAAPTPEENQKNRATLRIAQTPEDETALAPLPCASRQPSAAPKTEG